MKMLLENEVRKERTHFFPSEWSVFGVSFSQTASRVQILSATLLPDDRITRSCSFDLWQQKSLATRVYRLCFVCMVCVCSNTYD